MSLKQECRQSLSISTKVGNPSPEAKALLAQARPMNEAAGTHPKVVYVSSHTDFAKTQKRF